MLFGAITAVDPSTGFPSALPTNFQPIAETIFSPPPNASSNSDTLAPLLVTLVPGEYALIFGSNRFGATGDGAMPGMSGNIGQPSYFIGAIHSTDGTDQNWNDDDPNITNMRFVILGNAVPEPSTIALLATGALGLLWARRRHISS
jgi:hypothetical protein